MTIEQAIVRKLREVLADSVGSRVYRDTYPQSDGVTRPAFPFLVYQHLADDDQVFLSGGRDDTRRDAYLLEIWSDDAAHCDSVRETLKESFAGGNCRGRWGGEQGAFVCGAICRDAAGDFESPLQGDEILDRAERVTLTVTWDKTL